MSDQISVYKMPASDDCMGHSTPSYYRAEGKSLLNHIVFGTGDSEDSALANLEENLQRVNKVEEASKRDTSGLTHEEIYQACKNIGINLDCPGCSTAFYTGFGGEAHDKNCSLKRDTLFYHRLEEPVKSLLRLAEISLSFGLVNRRTKHPDGTLESDSTHSIMLSLVCCSLASEHYPELDLGLISQMCVIHDLHECISGDVQTLRISQEEIEEKEQSELIAVSNLKEDLPLFWSNIISRYHSQTCPEARFVRSIDKILPKLTHLLNNCRVLLEMEMSAKEFEQRIVIDQFLKISEYSSDFPVVLALHSRLAHMIYLCLRDRESEI